MKDIIIDGEPQEVTEIRKKIIDSFKDLEFYEEEHKYFLHGNELKSVTHIAHEFQEPFDEERIAENYALKHGNTKEYWIDQWHYNSLKATTSGTLTHEFAEGYFWLKNGLKDKMPESCKFRFDKKTERLIPTRPKEEGVIKLYDDLPSNLWFVMNETKVFSGLNPNSELNPSQQYCGTFDLLLYYKHPTDDSKSGLILCDWKTNANLYNDFSRTKGKMMLPPFNIDYYDEAYSAYVLQLSCYQIPLEDIGLKVLGRRILWLKDDGTYEKIETPDVTKELRKVL